MRLSARYMPSCIRLSPISMTGARSHAMDDALYAAVSKRGSVCYAQPVSDIRRCAPCLMRSPRVYAITEIISIGTAGALSPLLSVGALLLPACVMNRCANCEASQETDVIAVNYQHENVTPPLPIRAGTLVTTSHPVWSKTERENMHALTGADAVDMEGYAVASFSRARAIPLTILRYIADDYDPCGRALFKRRVATGAHHLAEATRRAAALSAVVPYWA